MNIQEEGNKILNEHAELYKKLIQIPTKREIEYREEIENGKLIGKPRFKQREYEWSLDLLKDLHNHLQNIFIFFEKYYFWYDDILIPLIDKRFRRNSKKSIIFLLEQDIYATDEIYGDYLIEKIKNKTVLSYHRRDKKIRQFKINTTNSEEIKKWICRNAIYQIQEQFKFLWNRLKTEIKVCMEEFYHKKRETVLSLQYLKEQVHKVNEILNVWPEAALLNIGRIIELWLKNELEYRSLEKFDDIIRFAEVDGLISKQERKLLSLIRKNYNDIKHNLYYKVDKAVISKLISDFLKKINLEDNN